MAFKKKPIKKVEKKVEKEPKVEEIVELVEKLSGSAKIAQKLNSLMR